MEWLKKAQEIEKEKRVDLKKHLHDSFSRTTEFLLPLISVQSKMPIFAEKQEENFDIRNSE
jgi:hypothetical protein